MITFNIVMKRGRIPGNTLLVALIFILGGIYLWGAAGKSKIHDFEGKCQMCHRGTPPVDANPKDILLIDEGEKLCTPCHTIDRKISHPIYVVPSMPLPGEMRLDGQKRMTCLTCHDVHKEDKVSITKERFAGLLRGHVRGRAFCFICHSKEIAMPSWRHQASVSYAHRGGSLTEKENGSILDSFSRECLSCHDGTISKTPSVEVREGLWKHGIGLSHPIGVRYPQEGDFVIREHLPREIRLFGEKVGCLSCHDPYARERDLLVMKNRRSRLCLSCHKK